MARLSPLSQRSLPSLSRSTVRRAAHSELRAMPSAAAAARVEQHLM